LLYALAAAGFAMSRLPRFDARSKPLAVAAFAFALAGLIIHAELLFVDLTREGSFNLTLAGAASLIGIELALIAIIAAFDSSLRGMAAGLLVLAALTGLATGTGGISDTTATMSWQLRLHVMLAMAAYGLLTVGAIVAIYALIQERRLRAGKLSALNQLFAPLETTERLLYGVTAGGLVVLAASLIAGSIFIENLFAQHLSHKVVLSLLAVIVFGVLVAGRYFAGWRGKRAVYLYLGGYLLLGLAYFGSRFVLENVLGRSWGG
jgi:ABC-type uncharacterized transport system permease subunit